METIFKKQTEAPDFNVKDLLKNEAPSVRSRITEELEGLGPLKPLFGDPEITEVMVNAWDRICFEKHGKLHLCPDHFYSEMTLKLTLERLAQECQTYFNREKPFVESQLGRKRITLIFGEIAAGAPLLSVRTQPEAPWTLSILKNGGFMTDMQVQEAEKILKQKKNFLVIGATGSGKTSFLQGLISSLPQNERLILLEDTRELRTENPLSVSLLTRYDPSGGVRDVTMDDLLKRALRLRPDRLVMGEIRGPEAKSLLMALATGHDGSFGSLHAASAEEALLRLEMLVQMGAPEWPLESVRKLLHLTLHYIFVLKKEGGHRRLDGIYKISSLERTGFTFNRVDHD